MTPKEPHEHELDPSRPLEAWEIKEYRDYWPDVKKAITNYRYAGWASKAVGRFLMIAATTITLMWGMRDIIGKIIKALVGP